MNQGVKQDSEMGLYMVRPNGTILCIDPPVEMRVVGRFFPRVSEQSIHLERLNKDTGQWIPLITAFRNSKALGDF